MTDPAVVHRRAARVILVDHADRVLLVRGHDPGRPASGQWWITVGGGADEGESLADAARREVLEETGLAVGELGAVVLERQVRFEFEGEWIEQDEVFYIGRVDGGPGSAAGSEIDLDTSGWNDIERRSLFELRWWSVPDLATTTETVYPAGLAKLLQDNGIG
jgi:8-oxo-dGTP pyrophosphatase MutT (NUDIX family)